MILASFLLRFYKKKKEELDQCGSVAMVGSTGTLERKTRLKG